MKHKIFGIVLAAAAALGLASCDNWNPMLEKEGTVQLANLTVNVTDNSRAGVDVSGYTVVIKNSDGIVKQWKYSEMPEVFSLAVGDYSVEAYSHEVQAAEWDAPYYKGTKAFTIEANKITNIGTVECRLSNIKVHITFGENLLAMMGDDCKVTVTASDRDSLVFSKDETRDGYFEYVAESMTLVAILTGTVNGEQIEVPYTFADVETGKFFDLSFEVNEDFPVPEGFGGTIGTDGITLKTAVTEVNQNGNVTVEDKLIEDVKRPDQESPKEPDTPDNSDVPDNPDDTPDQPDDKVIYFVTDLSWTDPIPVESGKTYSVDILSEEGIANLKVKIESTNGNFIKSVGELMPTEFDLAYPGEYEEAFNSINLKTGTDVIDANDVLFDISELVPLLKGYQGTHMFTITVIDNKGNTKTGTLTFQTL